MASNVSETDLELDTLIPDSPNQPYDMHEVITRMLDDGEFLEVQALFAPNILCGFGRVEGHAVGIVANQPTQFAGCLDIDASEKAARFVRTCDAFNVPVLTFVDVPGFLPGTDQEWNGIIRRGAKLIYAYAEATVPKVTVITRKAYGGAYDVMGSKHLGADMNLAWPTAQIAVMGAQGAANIVHRKTLANAANNGDDVDELRAQLQQEYEDALCNPYVAAERGYVDAVIPPSHTRGHVARALRLLRDKRETLPPRSTGTFRYDRAAASPHRQRESVRRGGRRPGGGGLHVGRDGGVRFGAAEVGVVGPAGPGAGVPAARTGRVAGVRPATLTRPGRSVRTSRSAGSRSGCPSSRPTPSRGFRRRGRWRRRHGSGPGRFGCGPCTGRRWVVGPCRRW